MKKLICLCALLASISAFSMDLSSLQLGCGKGGCGRKVIEMGCSGGKCNKIFAGCEQGGCGRPEKGKCPGGNCPRGK